MNSTSRVMVTPSPTSTSPASSGMVSIAAARRGSPQSTKHMDPRTAIVGVCVATRSARVVAICDPHVEEQLAEETNGWVSGACSLARSSAGHNRAGRKRTHVGRDPSDC